MTKTIIITALIIVVLLGMTNTVYAQHITSNQRSAVEDDETITDILDICHTGLLIYKDVNGKIAVVCIIDKFNSQIINAFDQRLDINVDVKDNNNKGDDRHHDRDHNHDGGPDGDCLFNASLPKCDPDENGNCPDDFNLNEDGNCFPDHHEEGCPDGTHGVDDDETGQCYDNDKVDCPNGTELNDEGTNCDNIPHESLAAEETCDSGSVLENGKCAVLDSNCGGELCTSSQKEDTTTSNPILGQTEDKNDKALEQGAVDEQPKDTNTDSSNTATEDDNGGNNEDTTEESSPPDESSNNNSDETGGEDNKSSD